MSTTIRIINRYDFGRFPYTETLPKYYGNSAHLNINISFDSMWYEGTVRLSATMGNKSASDSASEAPNISLSLNNCPTNTVGSCTITDVSGYLDDSDENYLTCNYIFNESSINGGTISLNSSYSKTLGIEEYVYYSFTPTKSGSYTMTFTKNSSLKGWIATNTNNNSSSGNSTGSITQELNAGTTYYFGVKNTTTTNYSSGINNTITLIYNVPKTYMNYVYNGKNTRKEKEGESYSLDTISSLGYSLNGWTFVGWSDEPENYNIIYTNGDTFTISPDITEYYLYPIWRKSFVITYKYGYPTPTIETDNAFIYSYERFTDNYDPLATSTYSQTSIFYNTKRITETFIYDERTFSPGVWYINNTTNYISMGMGTNISSNINFNGAYSSPNLSLFYEGNNEKVHGDTPDITNINQIYNSYNQSFQSWKVAASECGFTLSGKKFKEWNTQADGKGTSYKVGEHISVSVNTTVYAIWIDADTPFMFINGKEIKPYIYRNNKYYEIKIL